MEHSSPSASPQALPNAETLRHLYHGEGKTIRQIAAHYHCRPAALLALMDEAGIVRRRPGRARAALPDWDKTKLRLLVKVKGMPYVRAFARARGVNQMRLAALLGERPLPRGQRSHYHLIDHDNAIRRAYNDGTKPSTLAHQYRCSRRAIYYSLDRTSGNQCANTVNRLTVFAH